MESSTFSPGGAGPGTCVVRVLKRSLRQLHVLRIAQSGPGLEACTGKFPLHAPSMNPSGRIAGNLQPTHL